MRICYDGALSSSAEGSGTDYPRKYKPEDVNIVILNASNNVPFVPSTAIQHFNPFIFPIQLSTKINQHQWYYQKQYHMAHKFVSYLGPTNTGFQYN